MKLASAAGNGGTGGKTAKTAQAVKVPFLDLKAQYAGLKGQIRDAIDRVLDSAEFVGGRWVEEFEEKFARSVKARHAVGVSSGTAALELSLKALGVGPGHEVIVPANSFFATAEAVSNVGAVPVFADANPTSFHLDISSAGKVVGKKTRAIIPVHLYGRAMAMGPVEELARRHGLLIVEDACQAHGTAIDGTQVGSGQWPVCFSFYPGKNLGAYGDAGAITCNDSQLAQKLRILREHGSPAKYQHSVVGANERLDSIQAVVLSTKLDHLDEWNRSRIRHAGTYRDALAGSWVVTPESVPEGEHNYHLFVIRSERRDQLREYLQHQGIGTGIHYPTPIHLTAAYQALGAPKAGSLPVSERLAGEILSLPMYPELESEQVCRVVQALLNFTEISGRRGEQRSGIIEKSYHV